MHGMSCTCVFSIYRLQVSEESEEESGESYIWKGRVVYSLRCVVGVGSGLLELRLARIVLLIISVNDRRGGAVDVAGLDVVLVVGRTHVVPLESRTKPSQQGTWQRQRPRLQAIRWDKKMRQTLSIVVWTENNISRNVLQAETGSKSASKEIAIRPHWGWAAHVYMCQ